MEKNGLQIAGVNPEADLVEIVELKNHPYFVGTQFHPNSAPARFTRIPLFLGLIRAALSIPSLRRRG